MRILVLNYDTKDSCFIYIRGCVKLSQGLKFFLVQDGYVNETNCTFVIRILNIIQIFA